MKKYFSYTISAFLSLIFYSQTVFATSSGNPFVTDRTPFPHWLPPPPGAPINTVDGVLYILSSFIELAQMAFWVLAVGFGLYGAYLYLFSAGNKEQTSQARKVFVYAVVAGILAILAYGVPAIIEGIVFGF